MARWSSSSGRRGPATSNGLRPSSAPHVLKVSTCSRASRSLQDRVCANVPPKRWAPPRVRGPGRVPGLDRRIMAKRQVHHPPGGTGGSRRSRFRIIPAPVPVDVAPRSRCSPATPTGSLAPAPRNQPSPATGRRAGTRPARRATGARQPPSAPAAGGEVRMPRRSRRRGSRHRASGRRARRRYLRQF